MLEEIKCSLCNCFYNITEKIPIVLNNCTHNVCQSCFITYNDEGKCPYDGKPFSFDKIMINKKLIDLFNYLTEKNIMKELDDPNEDEEDRKKKKEKIEKINLKIDILEEFVSVIKTKFCFEDKEQNIKDLEKQINENYEKIKNDLQNQFKNSKQKYINTKPKEKAVYTNLEKNYYQYNINLINNFKKDIEEIKTKHENWRNDVAKFMDEITGDIDNLAFNYDKYSEGIEEKIKNCEKLSSDINSFNEKFAKLKFKIRNAYIITSKNGEIQITFNEKKQEGNLTRINSSEALLKPNPNNIAQKLIKNDEGKNTEQNKANNKINNLTESINSFCFGNDITNNQLIDDENLISWDLNDKNILNDDYLIIPNTINDNNTNYNTKSNIDDELFSDSFISNVDDLGLTDKKITQKKLTKDRIVFIKNKLKSESINCSGYDIGDEGVKKLLEFMIKKNLDLKANNTFKKEQIKYKELKLSRCGLTNEALNYIKSLMEVCKNTISHINLSRNYIDINGVSILCSILIKNPQLKDLKLSKNNINQNGKEMIEECIKQNNLSIKLEL